HRLAPLPWTWGRRGAVHLHGERRAIRGDRRRRLGGGAGDGSAARRAVIGVPTWVGLSHPVWYEALHYPHLSTGDIRRALKVVVLGGKIGRQLGSDETVPAGPDGPEEPAQLAADQDG